LARLAPNETKVHVQAIYDSSLLEMLLPSSPTLASSSGKSRKSASKSSTLDPPVFEVREREAKRQFWVVEGGKRKGRTDDSEQVLESPPQLLKLYNDISNGLRVGVVEERFGPSPHQAVLDDVELSETRDESFASFSGGWEVLSREENASSVEKWE
jgi:hypothetical protein